jgi:excisionase family DNA binding protein
VLDLTDDPDCPLPAEWVRRHQSALMRVSQAAKRAGLDAKEIKRAMAAGELEFVLTDGSTRLIAEEALEAWLAARPADCRLLTPRDVVAETGISYDRIKAAVDAGRLRHSKTSGGHARFTSEDVRTWLTTEER